MHTFNHAHNSNKPLLFLDVDGVLNPEFRHIGTARKLGYQRMSLNTWSEAHDAHITIWYWYNPTHNQWLQQLAERYDMVWATSWGGSANVTLSPIYNTPKWPVCNVGLPAHDFRKGDLCHKTVKIAGYAAGRDFVWVDDLVARADRNFFREFLPETQNALGYRVEAGRGITDKDINFLTEWATTRGK